MGIIRFCPGSDRDPSSYNMLYSYLNNKQRYGIVDTSQVEMFMVPLAAFQPMPSKLHPLGGPGMVPGGKNLLPFLKVRVARVELPAAAWMRLLDTLHTPGSQHWAPHCLLAGLCRLWPLPLRESSERVPEVGSGCSASVQQTKSVLKTVGINGTC